MLTTIAKEVLNPLQRVPPHAILVEFHGQSVMRGLVEGLAEVECNGVYLLFVVQSLRQVLDDGDKLAFTRTTFSKIRLLVGEDVVRFKMALTIRTPSIYNL